MNKIEAAINSHKTENLMLHISELLPKQIFLLQYKPLPNKKSLLLWGGTRSGKTTGTCLRSVVLSKNIKNYTTFCFATTLGQCMLILYSAIIGWLQHFNVRYEITTFYHHPSITLQNGSKWLFGGYQGRGVDNFAMGVAIDRIIVDEARHLTDEQFSKLYSRLSGTSEKNNVQGIDLITNPEGTDSWLYKYFLVDKKGEEILFPPQDNKKNLVDGYLESMEEELPEYMKKRLIYSQWTQAEGAVFPDIDNSYLVENYNNISEYFFGGLDFGFQHSFAFVLIEISQCGDLIVRDSYSTNKTDHETQAKNICLIIDSFIDGQKKLRILCDHDPQGQMQLTKLINEQKSRAYLENAKKTHKGDVCIFLNRLIKRKKLKIVKTKTNKKLLTQLENSVWDKEIPLKKEGIEDDLLDALIYSVSKIYNKQYFLKKFKMEAI